MSFDLETALENIDTIQADLYASLEEQKLNTASKIRSHLEIFPDRIKFNLAESDDYILMKAAALLMVQEAVKNENMFQNGVKLVGTEKQKEILRLAIEEFNKTAEKKLNISAPADEGDGIEAPSAEKSKKKTEQSINESNNSQNSSIPSPTENILDLKKSFKDNKKTISGKIPSLAFWFSHSVNAIFAISIAASLADYHVADAENRKLPEISQKTSTPIEETGPYAQKTLHENSHDKFAGEGIVFLIQGSMLRVSNLSNEHDLRKMGIIEGDNFHLYEDNGALNLQILRLIYKYAYPKDYITFILRNSQSSSLDVANIQNSLNELGYKAGKEDGIFGPKTSLALISFMKRNTTLFADLSEYYKGKIIENLNANDASDFVNSIMEYKKSHNDFTLNFFYR